MNEGHLTHLDEKMNLLGDLIITSTKLILDSQVALIDPKQCGQLQKSVDAYNEVSDSFVKFGDYS